VSLYLGLMSGTSTDAVDAALLDLDAEPPALVAARSHPLPAELRDALLEVAGGAGDHLDRVSALDVRVGEVFAEAALALIREAGLRPGDVAAIGSHGQTVRHRPHQPVPRSVQIGDPNVIAERTGVTTVADFRRRDIAAGGEGAPLAPAFHAAVFRDPARHRTVVNIGGIANLTALPPPGAAVRGFDTGPGNALLDAWAARHLGQRFDADAAWAATGRVHPELLRVLRADDYFSAPPPKSTGREYFDLPWLERALERITPPPPSPQDVQRTLCALTAGTVSDAIEEHAPATEEVFVCGGGSRNPLLMEGLRERLGGRRVASTAELGIDPGWVEAAAFAWLARRRLEGHSGNLPEATGARRAVVLGGVYAGSVPAPE